MTKSIRALILEDRSADAELMVHELRRAGFDPDWKQVQAEADFVAALGPELDVILADWGPARRVDTLDLTYLGSPGPVER